jgi:hypothetical protein
MCELSRKALKDYIATLGPFEHGEIFRMFEHHNVPYTRNKNGIFVNITSLDPTILEELAVFVKFCQKNNEELEDYDKRLNQCKLYQNLNCMTKPDGARDDVAADASVLPNMTTSSMMRYMEDLENSMDNESLRRGSSESKYMAARKRFSKRVPCRASAVFESDPDLSGALE